MLSTLKLIGVFALIMLLMAGAFYWYFSYSQSKINALEQSTAKLTESVQIQQQAMQDQLAFQKQQNGDLVVLQQKIQDATADEIALAKSLSGANLDSSARANAKALEDKINKATAAAIQQLEAETQPK